MNKIFLRENHMAAFTDEKTIVKEKEKLIFHDGSKEKSVQLLANID